MSDITEIKKKNELETQQQQREMRGAKLFRDGNVCMTETAFYVQSETHADTVYEVQDGKCNCPDFERRQLPCKHVFGVEFYFLAAGLNNQ